MRIFGDRWKKTAIAVSLSFGLLGGAAQAQNLPEPPADSYVGFRMLSNSRYESPVSKEELRSHPVFRLLTLVGTKYFQIKPFEFLDTSFEGTAVAGLLAKNSKDGMSSLKAFFADQDLRSAWKRGVDQLSSLATDLKYQAESDGTYPENLQTYLDEVRYSDVYLPTGMDYKYERLNDGKDFRLTAVFTEDAKFGEIGKPPIFTSQDEPKNLEPTKAPLPLNFVIGVKLKEQAALRELLDRLFGPAQAGFWRGDAGLTGAPEFLVTVRGDWLLCSDQMGNISDLLKSVQGSKVGWSRNPAFQKVARNLDEKSPFLMFFDSQALVKAVMPATAGEMEKKLSGILGPVGYSVVPYAESQMRVEMFFGVNAPKESKLEKFLTSSVSSGVGEAVSASNIPWDVSNVFAIEYRDSKLLADSIVDLYPEFNEDYDMFQDIYAGKLGFDAELGFNKLLQDSVIVSFERVDIITNAIEASLSLFPSSQKLELDSEMDMVVPDNDSTMDSGAEQAAEAVAEGSMEPSTDVEETQPDLSTDNDDGGASRAKATKDFVSRLPFTVAMRVPSEINRDAIVKQLEPVMGEAPVGQDLFGVQVMTGEDGLLSYAVDGEWVYLSGGRTERLMRHMLEAAHGRKQPLASVDSWARFTSGSKGRLIAFGHQKVDAVYSIAKGFLLMMGSEFRPLAKELGELRDYHTVLTSVPDGFMLVGEIVKGDDR